MITAAQLKAHLDDLARTVNLEDVCVTIYSTKIGQSNQSVSATHIRTITTGGPVGWFEVVA